MSAPKLSDIARRAGVSAPAVSIVLNDHNTKRVSAAKRARILELADEMGYTPNEIAKALAERRTRLLGLAVPFRDPIFFNQFIAQALSGIQSSLMERGYNLLVYSPKGRKAKANRGQFLDSKFTDGLIFINTRSCTTRDINQTIGDLETAGIKFTMINSYYGDARINYVGVDDALIGEQAVEYLTGHGHKKIAFLSGSPTLPTHIQLLHGFKRGLAAAGLQFRPENVACTGYEAERAEEILDKWFATDRSRPTAVFTADDTILEFVYDYLDVHNLRAPKDIAILARANTSGSGGLRPRPTAFQVPTYDMGRLAADMLIDSIERPTQTRQRVLLPFTFTEGRTT